MQQSPAASGEVDQGKSVQVEADMKLPTNITEGLATRTCKE